MKSSRFERSHDPVDPADQSPSFPSNEMFPPTRIAIQPIDIIRARSTRCIVCAGTERTDRTTCQLRTEFLFNCFRPSDVCWKALSFAVAYFLPDLTSVKQHSGRPSNGHRFGRRPSLIYLRHLISPIPPLIFTGGGANIAIFIYTVSRKKVDP